LFIVEARPDLELSAVLLTDSNGAHKTSQSASSRLSTNHSSLGILEFLDFEEELASFIFILRLRVSDHHALSPVSSHYIHLFDEFFAGCTYFMFEQSKIWALDFSNDLLELAKTLVEGSFSHARSIEDHIGDALPLIVFVLAFHNAHALLEVVSLGPQLTIQVEILGQGRLEVRGWEELEAIPRPQVLTVPDAADAIQLLTHVPAGRVMLLRLVNRRQHSLDIRVDLLCVLFGFLDLLTIRVQLGFLSSLRHFFVKGFSFPLLGPRTVFD